MVPFVSKMEQNLCAKRIRNIGRWIWILMTIAYRHYAEFSLRMVIWVIIFSATHCNYNHNLFHRSQSFTRNISALPVKQKATSWPLAHGAKVLEQAGTNRCFLIGHRTSVGWGRYTDEVFLLSLCMRKWYVDVIMYNRLYTCVVYLDVYDTVPMNYRKH